MSIQEVENQLNKDVVEFLAGYSPVFDRIVWHEEALREGAINTPGAIDESMKELVSLYSTLNTATAFVETKTTVNEAKAYIKCKESIERLGMKVTEKYINSQVDIECEPYHRLCKIFETYRDSCDRMISVLQSSLKHAERENAITKHS